jgi:hypothetical protein
LRPDKNGFSFHAENADRLKDTQGTDTIGIGGIFGGIETDCDMAHRGKIVNLIRLDLLDNADQVGGVGQIAEMQKETRIFGMRLLVKMIDTVGVEQR